MKLIIFIAVMMLTITSQAQSRKKKRVYQPIYKKNVYSVSSNGKLTIHDTVAFATEFRILATGDHLVNLMYIDGTISDEKAWEKWKKRYDDLMKD